eukprot:Nk52_evm90s158 gene=Nk52_evmTU90s158
MTPSESKSTHLVSNGDNNNNGEVKEHVEEAVAVCGAGLGVSGSVPGVLVSSSAAVLVKSDDNNKEKCNGDKGGGGVVRKVKKSGVAEGVNGKSRYGKGVSSSSGSSVEHRVAGSSSTGSTPPMYLRFQLKQLLDHQHVVQMERLERQHAELLEKKKALEREAELARRERRRQCSWIMRRKVKDMWQMQSFNQFKLNHRQGGSNSSGSSVGDTSGGDGDGWISATPCYHNQQLSIEIISTKFVRLSFPKSSYYVYVISVKMAHGNNHVIKNNSSSGRDGSGSSSGGGSSPVQWLCGRRYSEFLSFYNDICKRHPHLKLSPFPKKSPFSKLHCKEILEERKKQLNTLFQELLQCSVCREDGFWCFIGVPPLRYIFGQKHESEYMGYNFPSDNAFEDECQTIDPYTINTNHSSEACGGNVHVVGSGVGHMNNGDHYRNGITNGTTNSEDNHDGHQHMIKRQDAQRFVQKVISVLEAIVLSKGYPDKHLPAIDEFICMTLRTGHVSFSTIVVAFIYLQRLKLIPKYVIGNIHLLWLVSLSVAAKFCNDEPIRPSVNQWFSRQVMFSKEEEFLNALNFDLNVTYDQYSMYIDFIEEWINRCNGTANQSSGHPSTSVSAAVKDVPNLSIAAGAADVSVTGRASTGPSSTASGSIINGNNMGSATVHYPQHPPSNNSTTSHVLTSTVYGSKGSGTTTLVGGTRDLSNVTSKKNSAANSSRFNAATHLRHHHHPSTHHHRPLSSSTAAAGGACMR